MQVPVVGGMTTPGSTRGRRDVTVVDLPELRRLDVVVGRRRGRHAADADDGGEHDGEQGGHRELHELAMAAPDPASCQCQCRHHASRSSGSMSVESRIQLVNGLWLTSIAPTAPRSDVTHIHRQRQSRRRSTATVAQLTGKRDVCR